MRRIKRSDDFDVSLVIKNDNFIRPPRDAQRTWLVNRALREFCDDLNHLNEQAGLFVSGRDSEGMDDRTEKHLTDNDIMEDWQIPIMRVMAHSIADRHGDVLEIGFGRGIASSCIQQLGVKSHTIVECNPSVVERFESWKQDYPDQDIRLLAGRWEDRVGDLDSYDGIFFHTYPLNEQQYAELVVQSVTFAEHFFSTASDHLRPGGRFTYLTNETDSLSRAHQRALLKHFTSFSISLVENLNCPDETRDAHWSDRMVVIQVVK